MSLGDTSEQRSTWPKGEVISHLATRCLCLEGQVEILLDSQPANCNWPANQPCAKMLTFQTSGWSHCWWWENWVPNHIGPQSRVPALPLDPLGEWCTWPRPGKWQKWALLPVIYHWHYLRGPFAVLYLHYLITYSCTQCREMLKMHTYIAALEVCGHFICRMLFITSLAGLLHPTLVWRFLEATNIPMQVGAFTCVPSNSVALPVLIYTWVGWSLVNLKQGSVQPKLPQFWFWVSLKTHNLSHMSQELYHCVTEAWLDTKAVKTIFCLDQFMHILPQSIWYITTTWYYFLGTTFIITNGKCYGKNQKSEV